MIMFKKFGNKGTTFAEVTSQNRMNPSSRNREHLTTVRGHPNLHVTSLR